MHLLGVCLNERHIIRCLFNHHSSSPNTLTTCALNPIHDDWSGVVIAAQLHASRRCAGGGAGAEAGAAAPLPTPSTRGLHFSA
jgi:hypothetical protein